MPSPLGIATSTSNSSPSLGQYQIISGKAVRSIFGNAQFSPFPVGNSDDSGNVQKIGGAAENHNDSVYDISVQGIIDYTSQYDSMKLNYRDFAYLKDVGVYPNNRLIVARRFASPVGNDLTALAKGTTPMATLVSYVKDENFLDISFGEKWVEADPTFKEILNDIGKDLTSGNSDNDTALGDVMAGGAGVVPLPGFTEGLQYLVMNKMGLTDNNGIGNHPLGNPNLIREAMRRKTVAAENTDSGLDFSTSITMKIEYEQKFISGLDPTLVYLDLIQNVLTFATSDSIFQFNGNFSAGAKEFVQNLISGEGGKVLQAIAQFTSALVSAVTEVLDFLVNQEQDQKDKASKEQEAQGDNKQGQNADGTTDSGDDKPSLLENLAERVKTILSTTIGTIVSKYKMRILGVINALTGSPSGPWHITIGNPKRPIFCSGDMIMDQSGVKVTFGKTLAFNDLPASFTVDVTFKNARSLGAQEIFDRLNTGKGRSYIRVQQSFVEKNDVVVTQEDLKRADLKRLENLKADLAKLSESDTRRQKIQEQITALEGQINARSTQPSTTPPVPAEQPKDTLLIDKDAQGSDYLSYTPPPASEGTPTAPPLNTPSETQAPNPQQQNAGPVNPGTVGAEVAQISDEQRVAQAQVEAAARAEALAAVDAVTSPNRVGTTQSDVATPGDNRPVGEQTAPQGTQTITDPEEQQRIQALTGELESNGITNLTESQLNDLRREFGLADLSKLEILYIPAARRTEAITRTAIQLAGYPYKSYYLLNPENSPGEEVIRIDGLEPIYRWPLLIERSK